MTVDNLCLQIRKLFCLFFRTRRVLEERLIVGNFYRCCLLRSVGMLYVVNTSHDHIRMSKCTNFRYTRHHNGRIICLSVVGVNFLVLV